MIQNSSGSSFTIFVLGVLTIVGMWKLFQKAGKPGWASIIPIYNLVVILEIVNKPIWWIVLFFIPFVNVIVGFIVWHELSKSFGKDMLYTLGLFFLPFIFIPYLAFTDAVYTRPAGPVVM